MAEYPTSFNIICLETEAFHTLVDQVVERVMKEKDSKPSKWISDKEAMELLNISSTTTLQKYRDEGSIRFSQPSRKVILYDRDSILDFIEKHAKDIF